MKKYLHFYVIAWIVAFVFFNIATFVVNGYLMFTPSFWVGYAFIFLAFVFQLICGCISCNQSNSRKSFLSFAIWKISFASLVAMFVVGTAVTLTPFLPFWIGAIVCLLILAINVICVIGGKAGAEIVNDIDEKVKKQTFFIKSMQVVAQSVFDGAPEGEFRDISKRVLDAVKYSDPMSSEALAGVDSQISAKFGLYKNAVTYRDIDTARAMARELEVLLNERNSKCKLLK